MYQNHRASGRGEQLTQYAIELFDLVDIPHAALRGNRIDSQFLRSSYAAAGAAAQKRMHERSTITPSSRLTGHDIKSDSEFEELSTIIPAIGMQSAPNEWNLALRQEAC